MGSIPGSFWDQNVQNAMGGVERERTIILFIDTSNIKIFNSNCFPVFMTLD